MLLWNKHDVRETMEISPYRAPPFPVLGPEAGAVFHLKSQYVNVALLFDTQTAPPEL